MLRKSLVLLSVLLVFSLPVYSQQEAEAQTGTAELIQLHQELIVQAKNSNQPYQELENEYLTILNELEQSYQKKLTEQEQNHQAELTALEQKWQTKQDELKANLEQQLSDLEAEMQGKIDNLKFQLSFYLEQKKNTTLQNLGIFGCGVSLGSGITGIAGFFYMIANN